MTAFVDFIRIKQRYPGRLNPETGEVEATLPMVDEGIIGKFPRSDETGEYVEDAEWAMQSKKKIRGSFDSLVIVHCDGFTVTLEGNIGRLDRPDNLYNLDLDATLQRCNELLARFGLPPFSVGEKVINPNPSAYDVKHGLFEYWTGATISCIHLTRNYSAGSPQNAQAVIDWLATQSVARIKRGRAGETTVQWGSKGGRKLIKAYIKAVEMTVHRHGRKKTEIFTDPVYQHCLQNGVVRLELEANRLLLRDNMLRFLGDITMSKLIRLFDTEVKPLLSRVREDVTRIELEHLPSHLRMTAAAYLRGENVRALLPHNTFYRHARGLRDYGLDIAEPLPSLHKFASVIKVIELQPLVEVPGWYWDHQRRMALSVVDTQQADQRVA
ncbi:phage/plasmid replication protein, II/X family [Chromobacterium haemolyticum]|uniref:phage/plasmid replication protein, II/X family n=1 Tax=Chromobacterium haemolyticum TaxID=394935 RepID=UPI002447F463|nr:phage/plasmid replication protein, II/X family [Chromobacterium haemolyticum]MDH0340243.1 phage/plasmid replication protein, II/X family [Chromobacterium haemolyticum]